LVKEATGSIAVIRIITANGCKVQNVKVVITNKSLLKNALDLAIKMGSVGSVLRTRNIRLRSSNRVEEDLLQSVAVGCRGHSGSVAGAGALSFEEIAVALVQLELEGGGLVEGPAGDAVDAGSDGQP